MSSLLVYSENAGQQLQADSVQSEQWEMAADLVEGCGHLAGAMMWAVFVEVAEGVAGVSDQNFG